MAEFDPQELEALAETGDAISERITVIRDSVRDRSVLTELNAAARRLDDCTFTLRALAKRTRRKEDGDGR